MLAIVLISFHGFTQAHQLRPLSESNQERVGRAEELVTYYTQRGDLNSAIVYLNQIILIYWQNQRLDKAAESYQRVANLYESQGDFINLQKVFSNQGLIFLDLEDLPNADRSFTRALEAARRTVEHRVIATALVDLAYVKTLRNENRDAIRLLEEAMNIALERNFEPMLPNIYQQLSRNYLAIQNIRQGEEYRRKYNDIREFLARQNMRGEFQEREERIQQQTLEAQAEARARELEIQINQLIFQQRQDSITIIVRATEDSLDRARERSEFQRQSIQLLESEAQRQEAEIERQTAIQNQQRTYIYAALMGGVLLFFLIIIMYRSNKLKQRANKELAEKNEEIQLTSEQLRVAFDKIEDQNLRITQSISYAKEIQKALFPPENTLNNFLPESFIFFQPVDMVSGDFYWFREILNQQKGEKVRSEQLVAADMIPTTPKASTNGYYNFKNDKFIISAVDCTGHGVPGAFMSMIGYNLLDSITQSGITHPDRILNKLHVGVRRTLKQDEGENRDGMDLSLCVIDKVQKTIEFAGANNPLIYIRNDEVTVIKGDRYSIGGMQKEGERRFTAHTVNVDQPTCFYIFSDGYTDQFGGEKGRSLLLKNFKELLLQIHKEPMEMQRQLLEDHFTNWKGKEDQIDDVIVIGFKLG
jgi:serine phosphatase RsbU (regulator of sigma subunit)